MKKPKCPNCKKVRCECIDVEGVVKSMESIAHKYPQIFHGRRRCIRHAFR